MMKFTQEEELFLTMPKVDLLSLYTKLAYHRIRVMTATNYNFENPEFMKYDQALKTMKALLSVQVESAVTLDDVLNNLIKVTEQYAQNETEQNYKKVQETEQFAYRVLFTKHTFWS